MQQGNNIGIILASTLVLPAALVWYFLGSKYRTREPKNAIFTAVLFGIIAVGISYQLELLFIPDIKNIGLLFTPPPLSWALRVSFMVALIEESAKFFPAAFFYIRRPYFRGPAEGVIYFAIIGLTFGIIENFLYIRLYGASGGVTRMLVMGFFHAATAALVGYYLGMAKAKQKSIWSALWALAAAIILHALYDTGVIMGTAFSTMVSLTISLGLNCALFVLYTSARRKSMKRL